MIIGIGIAVLALLLWRQRRRARKSTLAGLNYEKPTFSVDPPERPIIGRDQYRW